MHKVQAKKIIFGGWNQNPIITPWNQVKDLVLGTEIQNSIVGTKNLENPTKIEIQDSLVGIKTLEDPVRTKIHAIGTKTKNLSLTKNLCPKTKI
jgi:hypothetical protein